MVGKAGRRADVERERHLRCLAYALASFGLASVGYLWLGFDRAHAIGYGACAYVLFNMLNRRAMFEKMDAPAQQQKQ